MKVAKITAQLADRIKGKEYAPNMLFNPVQDKNDDWIVSLTCAEQSLQPDQYEIIDFEPKEE